MADPALPPTIQGLLSPQAYPYAVDRVELRQTHISFLLFAGDFVYKVKKPLSLGFLDFSTLDLRKHFCEEEVRLNQRLCADTYLGVVAISDEGGAIRIESDANIVEYAVKMRRLPDEGMMTPLFERNAVTPEMIERIARRMAEFHLSSERNDEIDSFGGLETVLVNWRENFEQTEPFIGRTIHQAEFDEIRAYIDEVAGDDEELFAQRVREGRARDCHGDLRADAVCFVGDSVCIFDCIEFNERFRYSDVAADIAFLAMDLEDRGRQDLSDVLMGRYLSATLDSTLPLVLPFYKCYRAYVRGKVDSFQLDQPEVSAEQKAAATASAHRSFELAYRYAAQRRPRSLIITIGVTGSGKSHLATALAARLGAALFSSDVTRKQLLGIDPLEAHEDPLYAGIYDKETTARAYQDLLGQARTWLARGKPVVLDATYLMRDQRAGPQDLATKLGAQFVALECEADEKTVWERLSSRKDGRPAVSDGRWEIYQAQQERREPVDDLPIGSHVVVDTTQPLTRQVDHVLEHLFSNVS
ncbi:MAG: AAA family ATPase [Dehalococcoidia bacterium]